MSVQIKMNGSGARKVDPIRVSRISPTSSPLIFTDIYEQLLNDQSLGEAELLELHKLILKKLTQKAKPVCH